MIYEKQSAMFNVFPAKNLFSLFGGFVRSGRKDKLQF